MVFKLNYKIVSRENRPDGLGENIYVEWRHDDGPVQDTREEPTHFDWATKTWHHKTVPDGTREVVHDMLTVKHGTPESVVIAMLEEKRPRLAANLGISQ